MTQATSIGQRYIDFLNALGKDSNYTKDIEQLFSPTITKVVNSKTICTNRTQLIAQMRDIVKTHGVKNVEQLELIRDNDDKLVVIRFEITYNDNTTESVITILKCDSLGLIQEINEVFGLKEAYDWQPA